MEERIIVLEKKFKELKTRNATNTTMITMTYTIGLVLDGQFPLIVIMEV